MNVWKKCGMLFLGIITISSLNFISAKAVNVEYDSDITESYTSVYQDITMPFLYGSPLEEIGGNGVDTRLGRLVITREDLSLQGNAGMDFELSRYYDSSNAGIGRVKATKKDALDINTTWVSFRNDNKKVRNVIVDKYILENFKSALKGEFRKYKKNSPARTDETSHNTETTIMTNKVSSAPYYIAAGWSYDFPWIETASINGSDWSPKPVYLHFGSSGTMKIAISEDSANKKYTITGLDGYDYKDVKLENYENTVDGIAVAYLLRDKLGNRTYFNRNGVIVLKKDAHGNSIRFTYRSDGLRFQKITDSVGREIIFSYGTDVNGVPLLSSVTVNGTKISGGVSSRAVYYDTKAVSYKTKDGATVHGAKLSSATVDGNKETYKYRIADSLTSSAGAGIASQRATTNRIFLLKSVTEGRSRNCYEYRGGVVRGSKEGNMTRDVATIRWYVTREYEQDAITKKKANGTKYDYFQKQGSGLVSYADFTEKDEDEKLAEASDRNINVDKVDNEEFRVYGSSDLYGTVTLETSYNPKKHKDNKKVCDYLYKKSMIDSATLQLKNKPEKNTEIYIYNKNGMLENSVSDGKSKSENILTYDNNGEGSLVLYNTTKTYGTNRSGNATISKEGYRYDSYRNIIESKLNSAFLEKNRNQQEKFTTQVDYFHSGTGYPSGDSPAVLSVVSSYEGYMSSDTKSKQTNKLATNGVDIVNSVTAVDKSGNGYTDMTKEEYSFDGTGNQLTGKRFSDLVSDPGSFIKNIFSYNALGQMTKEVVEVKSEKNSSWNRTYTNEEITYDSFGNELSYTDEKGNVTKTIYNEEKDTEESVTENAGTELETTEQAYTSEDGLKSATIDEYGRCHIVIRDSYGNTVIEKDETNGTWTEYEYVYEEINGQSDAGDDTAISDGEDMGEDSVDEELEEGEVTDLEQAYAEEEAEEEEADEIGQRESTALLVEERTYVFEPEGKALTVGPDGKETINYEIEGRGSEILYGTRHVYDDYGTEVETAEFSGGSMDREHCSSWQVQKREEEIDSEGITIVQSNKKELKPAAYVEKEYAPDYFTRNDDKKIRETKEETVTGMDGTVQSEQSIIICGENKKVTKVTHEYDEFGKVTKDVCSEVKTMNGRELDSRESILLYTYDYMGNVVGTTKKSRNSGEDEWVSQTTKSVYDTKGQLVESYTPRGLREGYATKYEYDILGRQIRQWNPITKEEGDIKTQCVSSKYDTSDNLTSQEVQLEEGTNAKTEYTYNDKNELVMVTSTVTENQNQYVQYIYDKEGNKVRQFVGMTTPLTFRVTGLSRASSNDSADTFTYMGITYEIEKTGENKKDNISETKYKYNKKNQLIAMTDPEGRTETYSYDIYGNMTKKTEKNGDVINYTYDYQNRLVKEVAVSRKSGKKTTHSYEYDDFGNLSKQDNKKFTYDHVSDIIIEEVSFAADTEVKKEYTYDSGDNCLSLDVSVQGNKKLSMGYEYDGADRLCRVKADNQTVGEYTYNEDGALATAEATGIHLVSAYGYDCAGDNTSLSNTLMEGDSVLSAYQSSYNLNSKKTEETSEILNKDGSRENNAETYTYDRLERLTKETYTNDSVKNVSYTYDSHNNRKEAVYGNTKIGYKYNKNDELYRTDSVNTKTKEDTVTLYKNDKNGNQLATVKRLDLQEDKTTFSLDVSLGDNQLHENVVNKYNAKNELIAAFSGNNKMTYEYDADGLRIVKRNKKKATYFIWDGDRIIMELNQDGKVQKRYIWGNNLISSDTGKGTDKVYFAYNPHGDVVQLLNERGNVTKNYTYDAFGNEVKPEKKDDNPYRYSGEYYDKETDTLYLRARYYDAGVGRFLTEDSYTGEDDEPLSLNLYAYCNNTPVNMADPSGHWGRDTRDKDTGIDSYVHMSLTYEAMRKINGTNMIITWDENLRSISHGKASYYNKVLLYGSVLPDYRELKKKRNVVLNKELKLTIPVSSSIYGVCHGKNIKLGGYTIKRKSNALHGKSAKRTRKLVRTAEKMYKKITVNQDKKMLMLGVALHSIQDFYAHSYVSDLEDFKKNKKNLRKRSAKIQVYHRDWVAGWYKIKVPSDRKNDYGDEKYLNREDEHAFFKDNPYIDFVEIKGLDTGNWSQKLSSKYMNKRYKDALSDSTSFLRIRKLNPKLRLALRK